MLSDQITFLEPQSNKDVGGEAKAQDDLRIGHQWRCPDPNHDSRLNGMANVLVHGAFNEVQRRARLVSEVNIDLAQTEEIEMVDREG